MKLEKYLSALCPQYDYVISSILDKYAPAVGPVQTIDDSGKNEC